LQRDRSDNDIANQKNVRSNQIQLRNSNRRSEARRSANLGAFANAANNRAAFRNQQRARESQIDK
jgi:hypothetical protein